MLKVENIFINITAKLKMDQKDIIIVISLVALVALGGFTYYLYSGVTECEVVATDLGAQLLECGAGVELLTAGLDACTVQATQCQEALITLQQLCAPYLPTE